MITIPENLTEFLHWVKERTEAFWKQETSSNYGFECPEWAKGAKWIGLTDEQIDEIEDQYAVTFAPEHREFLRILHTVDRNRQIEYTETSDTGVVVLTDERPFFYNWLTDEDEIRHKLEWPCETILADMLGEEELWLDAWGERPDDEYLRVETVIDWYDNAPVLVPLSAHRFLVSDEELPDRPVLSVWGADIIVHSWDLRTYLLREFEMELGLLVKVYDEELKEWKPESRPEAKIVFRQEFERCTKMDLPIWKDMIKYHNPVWRSFGLAYPNRQQLVSPPDPCEGEEGALRQMTIFDM